MVQQSLHLCDIWVNGRHVFCLYRVLLSLKRPLTLAPKWPLTFAMKWPLSLLLVLWLAGVLWLKERRRDSVLLFIWKLNKYLLINNQSLLPFWFWSTSMCFMEGSTISLKKWVNEWKVSVLKHYIFPDTLYIFVLLYILHTKCILSSSLNTTIQTGRTCIDCISLVH